MLRTLSEKLHFRGPSELIGVDIGTTSIKVCTVKHVKNGFKLSKFGRKTYDDDLLHDGNIIDQQFVAQELHTLLNETGVKSRSAAASLSSYTVITKRITIPSVAKDDLDQSVMLEVENVIPFPLQDIYYNYYVMNPDEEKGDMMNLLIVAAKREIVDGYVNTFNLAGLNLLILDVDIFAITNLVEMLYAPKDFSVVTADVGASVTNIAIVKGQSIEFTREILIGGKYLTADIGRALKIEHNEAEERKLSGGDEAQDLFSEFVINVASEINKTINFYVATKPKETVGKIFLTGGSALIPQLKEEIETETGIEVEFLNPFLAFNGHGVDEQTIDQCFAPVALYLSTRIGDLGT
jgi:type IV pilus assembly protein PilM